MDLSNPLFDDTSRFARRRTYTVGVDLGQAHDPTAIAVCERETIEPVRHTTHGVSGQGFAIATDYAAELHDPPRPVYRIRHLERLPLGMVYPAQVAYVGGLLAREPLASRQPGTFVDHTGVGRAVFDMFRQARLPRCYPVTITGGDGVTREGDGWHVAKLILISRVQALLHAGELSIEPALPDAAVLARELQDFRVSFSSAGNAIFGAREGAHDDLVLAVALAIFGASQAQPAMDIPLKWAW